MSAACGIMSVVANISMRHQRGRSEIGRLYRERCCKNFNFEKQFDSSFVFLCSHTCSHSEVLSERQHNQCGDCSIRLSSISNLYQTACFVYVLFFLVSVYAQSLWIYSKWVRERKRAALPCAFGLSQKQKKPCPPKASTGRLQ